MKERMYRLPLYDGSTLYARVILSDHIFDLPKESQDKIREFEDENAAHKMMKELITAKKIIIEEREILHPNYYLDEQSTVPVEHKFEDSL